MLEKELLLEQVVKLTDRANKKVEGQRASTLAVAKKVNSCQSRIKDATRKMMAMVSELSMQQVSLDHNFGIWVPSAVDSPKEAVTV